MSTIGSLVLTLDAPAVEPGQPIGGWLRWIGRMYTIEVRLRWRTSGAGDLDEGAAGQVTVTVPDRETTEIRFELIAPEQPFSFSGKLISLAYHLRAVHEGNSHSSDEVPIVIAPDRREILLAGASAT